MAREGENKGGEKQRGGEKQKGGGGEQGSRVEKKETGKEVVVVPDGDEFNGGKPFSEEESELGSYSDSSDDPDADSIAFSNEEHSKALYTFPGTGDVKDAKTVAWAGGSATTFIHIHGKNSAARYRLTRAASKVSSGLLRRPPREGEG